VFEAVLVALADHELPTDDAGWDELATTAVQARKDTGGFVPGLGHHIHKDGDPGFGQVDPPGAGQLAKAASGQLLKTPALA
jgi:hypothetical protein